MQRLINMVLRQITRRLVKHGVDRAFAGRGKGRRADDPAASQRRHDMRGAKRGLRSARRLGRF